MGTHTQQREQTADLITLRPPFSQHVLDSCQDAAHLTQVKMCLSKPSASAVSPDVWSLLPQGNLLKFLLSVGIEAQMVILHEEEDVVGKRRHDHRVTDVDDEIATVNLAGRVGLELSVELGLVTDCLVEEHHQLLALDIMDLGVGLAGAGARGEATEFDFQVVLVHPLGVCVASFFNNICALGRQESLGSAGISGLLQSLDLCGGSLEVGLGAVNTVEGVGRHTDCGGVG